MDNSSFIFAILLLLFVLSAISSASEAALLSLGSSQARSFREKKLKGSTSLEWLKTNPKKMIIGILIVNNIINILIPVLATVWATTFFEESVLTIMTGILTILIIVFGEILPKNFGISHKEKYSLLVAPTVYGICKILSPLIFVLEKFSDSVSSKKGESGITEEELLAMISLGEEHGALKKEERQHLENVLEFYDTTVEEVMTPRTRIRALDEEENLEDTIKFFLSEHHSRIPVYRDTIDQVVGIIKLRDIFEYSEEYGEKKLLKNMEMHSPFFVPITKRISELFNDFKRQHIHMAIVVDEHGGTAGIVTMEDLVEEVFGEILDESDIEEDRVKKISPNAWNVDASITIEEFSEETQIVLLSGEENEGKSLSLVVLEKLERFPRKGESIEFPGGTIVVEKMKAHTMERLRIYISPK